MNDDEWQLAFDAAHKGPEFQFLMFGAVLLIAAILVWRRGRSLQRSAARPRFVTAAALLFVLGVIWTGVGTGSQIRQLLYPQLQSAVDRSPVTEGRVQNFQPLTCHCPGDESFEVNGVHFAYASASMTQGFNQDAASGGPVRAGLLVRIHYAGDPTSATIVRLEIHR